jgi:hypothetical protein
MVPAILVTAMCCLPLGIPALVFASQVSTKIAAGDWDGARKASSLARTWTIIAAVAGVLAALGFVALAILGSLADH